MKEKMTKKDWFEVLTAIVKESAHPQKADALKFIDNEIELLNKKRGGSKTSKAEKANNHIKSMILDVLADNKKPMTVTQMLLDSRLSTWMDGDVKKDMSNQKLSSMVRQLVTDNLVIRTENKKNTLFSLPALPVNEKENEQDIEPLDGNSRRNESEDSSIITTNENIDG